MKPKPDKTNWIKPNQTLEMIRRVLCPEITRRGFAKTMAYYHGLLPRLITMACYTSQRKQKGLWTSIQANAKLISN